MAATTAAAAAMCDTVVSIGDDGVLFAKNSDRDANESQGVEWHAAATHDPGARLRCTWIEVPQVASTRAVVVSRPWWMWGAEMGANDAGVVIGNEAVFTTERPGDPALLGMDLLRLALERASSAHEAVGVLVGLLERHGQGGPCSFERPGFTYDNSFLVADPSGAVVLETAGRHHATEEVTGQVRAISNGLTIESFARRFSRRVRPALTSCVPRRARAEASARGARGPLAMMATLRDHGPRGEPRFSAVNGALRAPCAHAGGLVASTQTTASMVSDLRGDPLHWMTATSAPCLSVFKPVRVDEPLEVPLAQNRFDPACPWWVHERLHRAAMHDWGRFHAVLAAQRDEIERGFTSSPPPSAEAFATAAAAEGRWAADIGGGGRDRRPPWVRRIWRGLDEVAGFPGAAR